MKKIFLIIMAAVTALTSQGVIFESGGLFYTTLDDAPDAQVAVVAMPVETGATYAGRIIVPQSVYCYGMNYTVTTIADEAFMFSQVTQVQLPNTVTHIGEAAFAYAESLTDITLPLHLESLSPYVFTGTSIQDVVLPEGVERVDKGALADCVQLHTVILPSSVKEIASDAFDGSHNLYEIYCAAPEPPLVTGDSLLLGPSGVDLVVPDDESLALYEGDEAWGDPDAFVLYPNEDISPDVLLESENLDENLVKVNLGSHVAYKIYDGFGDLMAVTAASDYYFDTPALRENYEIVPTVFMGDDAAAMPFTAQAPSVSPVDDFMEKWTDPMVYSYNGVIYIKGDNYGTWTEVYDIYGMLYYQRPTVKGEIPDLPRNRVYIVRVGNYVKKVFL